MTSRPAGFAGAVAFALVAGAAVAFGARQGTLDAFTVLLMLWVVVGSLLVVLRPGNPVGWN